MSEELNQGSDEQREYYRIAVEIPVSVSPATEEEKSNPLAQVIFDNEMMEIAPLPPLEGTINPKLWMKSVNKKINEIISVINGDSEQGSMDTTFVEISAGGMNFINDQSFEVDEILKFKLALESDFENQNLKVFGKVIESKKDTQHNNIKTSVIFLGLNDDTQNILSNFVINKEREILRDRMEQGNY